MPCSLPALAGFTLIELCLGLVITSLVMAALGAFSLSMSSAWQHAAQTQSLTLRGSQARGWIQREIRNAKLLGAVRAGSLDISGSTTPAAVVFWKEDSNGDGYIQGAEVEMFEHDPVNHTLLLYKLGQGDATAKWQWSVFTDPAVCDQFKIGRTATVVASDVYGAAFAVSGTSGTSENPTLSFALKLFVDESGPDASGSSVVGADSRMMVEYGAATIRAPLAQPSY